LQAIPREEMLSAIQMTPVTGEKVRCIKNVAVVLLDKESDTVIHKACG
jgi:hypothetical protein